MRKRNVSIEHIFHVFDPCNRVPRSRDVILERRFTAIWILPAGNIAEAIEELSVITVISNLVESRTYLE